MTFDRDTELHLHFVTGKLAHPLVQTEVNKAAERFGFDHSIECLPITVAALMTPKWIRRHLEVPIEATHIIVPGFCNVKDAAFADLNVPVIAGPKDIRDLPTLFGEQQTSITLDQHDIEIIAEINHAPRLSLDAFCRKAEQMLADGADRIDVGADPSEPSPRIAEYVEVVTRLGAACSIDSFDPIEVSRAVDAGASLVLSVRESNVDAAETWGCEVVAIPEIPSDLDSLDRTVVQLREMNVPFRIDPILEPIGCGFGTSLMRYHHVRTKYPDAGMMMGIGNLTELTDVDSAGVNMVLIGLCQEWGVESVLTTEVIPWAQSSVRECDVARRLAFYSVENGVPPKRMADDLVVLRDRKMHRVDPKFLDNLAKQLRDNNYRIYLSDDLVHLLSAGIHLCGGDVFELFDRLRREPNADNIDASHAFYLGYELAKATTALQLGKRYTQDQSLDWGHLTVEEDLHRIERTSRHRSGPKPNA